MKLCSGLSLSNTWEDFEAVLHEALPESSAWWYSVDGGSESILMDGEEYERMIEKVCASSSWIAVVRKQAPDEFQSPK